MYDRTIMENIDYHLTMLRDEVRMRSYLQAMLQAVNPGDVVLDVGSGTGVLAFFACMAGARRVYAIEHDPVVELARTIRDHNGYMDRVIFLNKWSYEVELPEPADVLVTETIGNIGFEEGILGWIIDARERLLAQGGRIVPASIELMVALVEVPDELDLLHDWTKETFTLDFSPVRRKVANNLLWLTLSSDMLVSEPAPVIRAETASVSSADISGDGQFVAGRDGLVGGLGCWFRSELAPGISIDNGLAYKGASWSQILLPLENQIQVSAGDQLQVGIQVSGNGAHWRWQVGNARPEIEQREGSTLAGRLQSDAGLIGLRNKPTRNADGAVNLFILQMMDGSTTVQEMARRTADRFPVRFSSFEQALELVQLVASIHGRSDASG